MASTRAARRWMVALVGQLLAVASLALAGAPPAGALQSPAPGDCSLSGPGLHNGSFEVPTLPGPGPGLSFQPAAGGVPSWQTTDTAFEVWSDGFDGVSAAQGTQHVELNAYIAGTLYQAVPTIPGNVLMWRFAHRARLMSVAPGSAVDTMELRIGPTLLGAVSQGQFSDNDLAWVYHSGLYTVPAGQTSTLFAFEAVSTSSGDASAGNFLDDVSFSTAPCLAVTTQISDTNGGAVQRGDILTITTTAQNYGSGTATGVVLSASIPAQTTYVAGSLVVEGSAVTDAVGDDRGEFAGGTVSWRVGPGADGTGGGSLSAGAGTAVSLQVRVDAGATGTIASTSTAAGVWAGSGPLPASTSNTSVVALASANLGTAKSVAAVNSGATVAGAALGYDIATTNAGPDEALEVEVTDVLPPALRGASATPDPSVTGGTCVVVGGQATCRYPVLPVGVTVTTTIAGTLDPVTVPGSVIANTATSLALTEDPDLGDNTSSASAGPSAAVADLAIILRYISGQATDRAGATSSVAAPLRPGDPVVLAAQVVNRGPSVSPGSTAVLRLDPAARNWVVRTTGPAACLTFGARAICSIAALSPGSAISFEVSGVLASTAAAGPMVMSSSAGVTGLSVRDPRPDNDTATATWPVEIAATADLGTTAALITPVALGGPITYAISTVNSGPSNAIGMVVVDVVPEGVADPIGVPDPTIPGGACVTQGSTVTCSYPVVRPGVTVRTTIEGRAEAGLTTAIALTNQASARSQTPDPNTANDVALTSALASALVTTLVTTRALARTGVEARWTALLGAFGVLLGTVLLGAAAPVLGDPGGSTACPVSGHR